MNPYAPSSSETESVGDCCPICGAGVRSARFHLPFGFCGSCGNYLTIRNWNRNGRWVLPIVAIAFGPMLFQMLGLDPGAFPLIESFLVLGLVHSVYNRITGQLVPAVCWGWFAFRDDDRIGERRTEAVESTSPSSSSQ
ncbi:MAG: hypothetical protein AAFU85_23510 [Planctomycetota bacterium]